MQHWQPSTSPRKALRTLLVVALVGAPGAASATDEDLAQDAPPVTDSLVLISATTLDLAAEAQSYDLVVVSVSPAAIGETLVPARTPQGWEILSAAPQAGTFTEFGWQLPTLQSGDSVSLNIEARR